MAAVLVTLLAAPGTAQAVTAPGDLALHRPVTVSSQAVDAPSWSPARLTDGVDVSVPGNDGFHSNQFNTDPYDPEWVIVDLGSLQTIEQVWLDPAHPAGFWPAFGFPVSFCVQTSQDGATWQTFGCRVDLPTPGTAKTVLDGYAVGRYVRVRASQLALIASATKTAPARFALALAELEVYATPQPTQGIVEDAWPGSLDEYGFFRLTNMATSDRFENIAWYGTETWRASTTTPSSVYYQCNLCSRIQLLEAGFFNTGKALVVIDVFDVRTGKLIYDSARVVLIENTSPYQPSRPILDTGSMLPSGRVEMSMTSLDTAQLGLDAVRIWPAALP